MFLLPTRPNPDDNNRPSTDHSLLLHTPSKTCRLPHYVHLALTVGAILGLGALERSGVLATSKKKSPSRASSTSTRPIRPIRSIHLKSQISNLKSPSTQRPPTSNLRPDRSALPTSPLSSHKPSRRISACLASLSGYSTREPIDPNAEHDEWPALSRRPVRLSPRKAACRIATYW